MWDSRLPLETERPVAVVSQSPDRIRRTGAVIGRYFWRRVGSEGQAYAAVNVQLQSARRTGHAQAEESSRWVDKMYVTVSAEAGDMWRRITTARVIGLLCTDIIIVSSRVQVPTSCPHPCPCLRLTRIGQRADVSSVPSDSSNQPRAPMANSDSPSGDSVIRRTQESVVRRFGAPKFAWFIPIKGSMWSLRRPHLGNCTPSIQCPLPVPCSSLVLLATHAP